jgi:hypothetical protein
MRERVEALGGRFRVTTAPGQGTVVEAKLPLTVPDRGVGGHEPAPGAGGRRPPHAPGGTGLDATRLIRDACPATRVVLLTAFESPALQQQAEEAGCFAYLVKGCPPGTLRTVLHQAVAAGLELPPEADSPALEA